MSWALEKQGRSVARLTGKHAFGERASEPPAAA